MAKRETAIALTAPKALTPAPVIGATTQVEIDRSLLPAEFQGAELETIQTGFDPTVKWTKPGQFVAGVYTGVEEGVGPNRSNLYSFDARGKRFGVWGTTVLDRAIVKALANGQLHKGNLVMITYVGDAETDMQPCKIFHISVVKKGE